MTNDESDDGGDGDGDTKSPSLRWRYTNDLIGSVYLLAFVAIVALNAYHYLSLAAVPAAVRATWLAIAGVIATWMFGTAAVKAWRGS